MSTVGEQLLQARESRQLTIGQVAEITKIRSDHLRALEEGNYSIFAAPVYIRGFVRTYSTLLKLDVPQVMADLEGELGQARQKAEPTARPSRADGALDLFMLQLSRIDWQKGALGLGVVIVLLGIVLGGIVWRRSRTIEPPKDLKPAVYQPHQGADPTQPTLPLPTPKR
jgi:cytoskeletal protein RodZ